MSNWASCILSTHSIALFYSVSIIIFRLIETIFDLFGDVDSQCSVDITEFVVIDSFSFFCMQRHMFLSLQHVLFNQMRQCAYIKCE